MTRRIATILALACLIALSACAAIDGLQPTRTVEENVFFSSSNPQIRIKIAPDLTYLGVTERAPLKNRQGGLQPSIDEDEINNGEISYLFVKTTATRELSKGVVIRLSTITGDPDQWSPELLAGVGNILERGTIALEDKSISDGILASKEPYRYGIFAGSGLFSKEETAAVRKQGIEIPRCLLVKALEKSGGLGNKSKLQILYVEDVGGNACNGLINAPALSEDQRRTIASFVDRSSAALEFMDARKDEEMRRLIGAPSVPERKEPPTAPAEPEEKKALAAPAMGRTPAETGGTPDIGSKLHTLKQLLDEGLITRDDYDEKKKELLKDF